jgi:hypothetical protein
MELYVLEGTTEALSDFVNTVRAVPDVRAVDYSLTSLSEDSIERDSVLKFSGIERTRLLNTEYMCSTPDLNLTNCSLLNISENKIIKASRIIRYETKWSFHSAPLTKI